MVTHLLRYFLLKDVLQPLKLTHDDLLRFLPADFEGGTLSREVIFLFTGQAKLQTALTADTEVLHTIDFSELPTVR